MVLFANKISQLKSRAHSVDRIDEKISTQTHVRNDNTRKTKQTRKKNMSATKSEVFTPPLGWMYPFSIYLRTNFVICILLLSASTKHVPCAMCLVHVNATASSIRCTMFAPIHNASAPAMCLSGNVLPIISTKNSLECNGL